MDAGGCTVIAPVRWKQGKRRSEDGIKYAERSMGGDNVPLTVTASWAGG